MHQVVFDPNSKDPDVQLIFSVRQTKQVHGRVFRTFVQGGGLDYTLLTTSKDLHLDLGCQPYEVQYALCRIFARESRRAEKEHSQMIITFQFDKEEKSSLLVTRGASSNPRGVELHLSRAN